MARKIKLITKLIKTSKHPYYTEEENYDSVKFRLKKELYTLP